MAVFLSNTIHPSLAVPFIIESKIVRPFPCIHRDLLAEKDFEFRQEVSGMRVKSYVEVDSNLVPVEVEIKTWPGLPGLQIVGRPDENLKESVHRIKSALKASGFELPRSQQILINLSPAHIRKSSQGLELAIAIAYILETQEIQLTESPYVYGELCLNGEIQTPKDVLRLPLQREELLITGPCIQKLPWKSRRLHRLEDIFTGLETPAEDLEISWQRPKEGLENLYSENEQALIEILAVGEHSCLLAGAAGSGKSTLAHSLLSFLREPSPELQDQWRRRGVSPAFRPQIRPHHTTPIMSMLGGGSHFFMGEIAQAHGGILILDEFLEFHPQVLEALREPLEDQKIRTARRGQSVIHEARSLVLATTNLCPCGKYVPGFPSSGCSLSLNQCRSVRRKLSGPLLDRFQVLHFFPASSNERKIPGWKIFESIQKAWDFRATQSRILPNAFENLGKITESVHRHALAVWPQSLQSGRRKAALMRVARTLADLQESREILPEHLEKASRWTWINFQMLARSDGGFDWSPSSLKDRRELKWKSSF
ncbi:MAG: ATP-binding protein [Bdellovibrio sp.]